MNTQTTKPSELAKAYRPAEVEPQIADKWNAAGAFHADPAGPGKPYSIVIPPPNVTAALHMGHALNNTIQDILTRFHRMLGDKTLWMPGTDHAGIATQSIVDKRLQSEGKPALKEHKQMELEGKDGRAAFIEKIQAWKDEYEAVITDQLKSMGCSCDWPRQRFTMDDVCARAVREAFFKLFKDGLIYRGKRLVNWDPVTQTALADDEVENEEIEGHFWYMKYPVVKEDANGKWIDTGEYCTVATTRPETMLGDTAVAVNPNDEPRARFIGKFVRLPIVNRIIPVIGDDYVIAPDPESGDEKARYASGFLKVTPAHDPNDYEIGLRHDLPQINVMAPDASISTEHGWPTEELEQADLFINDVIGLSRYDARKAIVRWFEDNNLLEEVRDYRHSVGHSYRSHVPVEPYLSDQWYVKVTDDKLAGAALRAMNPEQFEKGDGKIVGEGELTFHPARYAKTFQSWHENIRDWCISRQLWWGHRIPVWSKRVNISWEEHSIRDEIDPSIPKFVKTNGCVRLVDVEKGQEFSLDNFFGVRPELDGEYDLYICLNETTEKDGADEILWDKYLEQNGFVQDPDVLDTWFSSALWPLSTMGWPDPSPFPDDIPEGGALLEAFNPTNVLCTAREIITLWVSRMVMFNSYFRDCLPFTDVFIHAMIQDGEGQKMSKSLGNGVDPLDIIHSHGSDAMRYTLTAMTTHTQDVRMPVDIVCPHSGDTFAPKMKTTKAGHRVAAATQTHNGKKMVTSYGLASGEAKPTEEMPLARNTSSKFDEGRNFSNKLWNAVRFALSNLEEDDGDLVGRASCPPSQQGREPDESLGPSAQRRAGCPPHLQNLPDRWILSRLARTIANATKAINQYEFSMYAKSLYEFVWHDFCDWYIESIKPTIKTDPQQRQVLACTIDAILRLLHPMMPFITERLFEALNDCVPERSVAGLDLPADNLLVKAKWPDAAEELVDDDIELIFGRIRESITMIREVRTINKVPPREKIEVSGRFPAEVMAQFEGNLSLLESMANVTVAAFGPDVEKPEGAAVVVRPLGEVYLHNQLDAEAERERLTKRKTELENSIKTLKGRLSNEKYVNNAPPHLVQETRDQLAAAEAELERINDQLDELD